MVNIARSFVSVKIYDTCLICNSEANRIDYLIFMSLSVTILFDSNRIQFYAAKVRNIVGCTRFRRLSKFIDLR